MVSNWPGTIGLIFLGGVFTVFELSFPCDTIDLAWVLDVFPKQELSWTEVCPSCSEVILVG